MPDLQRTTLIVYFRGSSCNLSFWK